MIIKKYKIGKQLSKPYHLSLAMYEIDDEIWDSLNLLDINGFNKYMLELLEHNLYFLYKSIVLEEIENEFLIFQEKMQKYLRPKQLNQKVKDGSWETTKEFEKLRNHVLLNLEFIEENTKTIPNTINDELKSIYKFTDQDQSIFNLKKKYVLNFMIRFST